MTLDLDAIAREAELKMCRAMSFPDSAAGTMNRNSPMFAPFFAALLLEKAAQVCEGMHEEDRPGDYADAVRSMAAGMGD